MTEKLTQLLGSEGPCAINDLTRFVAAISSLPLPVGSSEAKAFCTKLSSLLLTDARARPYPELQTLGFWLRPAAVETMLKTCVSVPPFVYRVSKGTVFVIPPKNVVVLFGYILSLALLCGNTAVIRLPSDPHPMQELLVTLIGEVLGSHTDALKNKIVLLRYDHDEAVTAAFSSACDVRLVWGSDATVEHIRQVPLPPHASHVGFGDRFSSLALDADAYLHADDARRSDLIRNLFNDIYLFDQLGCSSPRLLVWIGGDEDAIAAAADFYPRLSHYAGIRGYAAGEGAPLAKLNMAYLALHDLRTSAYRVYSPALSVISLPDLSDFGPFKSVNFGFGLIIDVILPNLAALGPFVDRRDQTLVSWGLSSDVVHAFAREGQGFDRIVAPGQALAFDPIWDGHNLFDLLTRLVRI